LIHSFIDTAAMKHAHKVCTTDSIPSVTVAQIKLSA